jgi:hypothetical protein
MKGKGEMRDRAKEMGKRLRCALEGGRKCDDPFFFNKHK